MLQAKRNQVVDADTFVLKSLSTRFYKIQKRNMVAIIPDQRKVNFPG